MLTNGSLQGVTILKDKILEDNTGVASHPDIKDRYGFLPCLSFIYIIRKICGTVGPADWSQLQTTFELLKCNRLVGAPVARRPHIRTAIQEAMRVAAGCRGTGVPANIGAG